MRDAAASTKFQKAERVHDIGGDIGGDTALNFAETAHGAFASLILTRKRLIPPPMQTRKWLLILCIITPRFNEASRNAQTWKRHSTRLQRILTALITAYVVLNGHILDVDSMSISLLNFDHSMRSSPLQTRCRTEFSLPHTGVLIVNQLKLFHSKTLNHKL